MTTVELGIVDAVITHSNVINRHSVSMLVRIIQYQLTLQETVEEILVGIFQFNKFD